MNAQCAPVVYDVADDSIAAICQARLRPQIRYQPKYGVFADISLHWEASSLIGRLTVGRCTVALGYNGGNRLPVGLHLIDVMLDHEFCLRTCNDGIIQEDCLLCCGKHVEVADPPGPPVLFRNTPSPMRQLGSKSAWSAHCCRTSSVKVMALSKSWYRLYQLGLTAFSMNSRESQTGGSCLKSLMRTTERFSTDLSL